MKNYVTSHPEFGQMVEAAINRRQIELPKVESQINALRRDLQNLEESEKALRDQLLDSEKRGRPGFMGWLEQQVEKMEGEKNQKGAELAARERYREEVLRKAGLESLEETLETFKNRFDTLTGTEQRDLIEKIIRRITVYKNNRLELVIRGDPSSRSLAVTSRNKSAVLHPSLRLKNAKLFLIHTRL